MNEFSWLKRLVLICLTLVLSFSMILSAYVIKKEHELKEYATSLTMLPEVNEVLSISTFQGSNMYYVAKVRLQNETEQYYFIQDDVVVYHQDVTEFLAIETILSAAQRVVQGDVKHYYLGLFEDRPIYEVVIGTSNAEHYVIVDAITADVVKEMIVQ